MNAVIYGDYESKEQRSRARFGEKMHKRIPKLKHKGDLQLLLERYLLGTFPKEIIVHEYEFRDAIDRHKCDIVIGMDRKFGIEVKLACANKKINKYLRDGKMEVNEFLGKHPRSKGILVIGDQKGDLERQKHTKKKDRFCTIIII